MKKAVKSIAENSTALFPKLEILKTFPLFLTTDGLSAELPQKRTKSFLLLFLSPRLYTELGPALVFDDLCGATANLLLSFCEDI